MNLKGHLIHHIGERAYEALPAIRLILLNYGRLRHSEVYGNGWPQGGVVYTMGGDKLLITALAGGIGPFHGLGILGPATSREICPPYWCGGIYPIDSFDRGPRYSDFIPEGSDFCII